MSPATSRFSRKYLGSTRQEISAISKATTTRTSTAAYRIHGHTLPESRRLGLPAGGCISNENVFWAGGSGAPESVSGTDSISGTDSTNSIACPRGTATGTASGMGEAGSAAGGTRGSPKLDGRRVLAASCGFGLPCFNGCFSGVPHLGHVNSPRPDAVSEGTTWEHIGFGH